MRKLSPGMLPSSRFGGPRATKTVIQVTWHMTTIAFLTVGAALLLSGSVLHGDAARALGLVAAGELTGFARSRWASPLPAIPVPPPRSRHAHRRRRAGVVGSSRRDACYTLAVNRWRIVLSTGVERTWMESAPAVRSDSLVEQRRFEAALFLPFSRAHRTGLRSSWAPAAANYIRQAFPPTGEKPLTMGLRRPRPLTGRALDSAVIAKLYRPKAHTCQRGVRDAVGELHLRLRLFRGFFFSTASAASFRSRRTWATRFISAERSSGVSFAQRARTLRFTEQPGRTGVHRATQQPQRCATPVATND